MDHHLDEVVVEKEGGQQEAMGGEEEVLRILKALKQLKHSSDALPEASHLDAVMLQHWPGSKSFTTLLSQAFIPFIPGVKRCMSH